MLKIESTSAATCRTNGIKVGTQLVSVTKYGECLIEVTHIGTWEMRAKTLSDDKRGPSGEEGYELQTWRGWMVSV
jgi:hypothetical protein